MHFNLCRTMVVMAMTLLTGTAFADVTVSQSNSPETLMGEQFASLFGAEHITLNSLPQDKLSALAKGPDRTSGKKVRSLMPYSEAWLAGLPSPTGDGQWDCLRRALYFEARGESVQGQVAVAEVILNRREANGFPKTICGVVHATGSGACAFSYMCDSISNVMYDRVSEDRAGRIARVMLDGAPRTLTLGATFFHASWARPDWGHLVETTAIGAHLFYKTAS